MQTKKHLSEADLKALFKRLEQRQRQGKKVLDNVDFMKLFNISRNTSTNWRNSGKIKFSRVGRRVFFKIKEIEKMLDEHLEEHGKAEEGRIRSRKAEEGRFEMICEDQGDLRGKMVHAEDTKDRKGRRKT